MNRNNDSRSYALPAADLLEQQARWLAPARARLLRQVAVARRRRVLDLGAGYGAVTAELTRRAGGLVIALDRAVAALRANGAGFFAGAGRVGGEAARLPFETGAFDLVFTQLTLLWTQPVEPVLDEVWRVLAPGGALVALEPDYGGMIEHPPEIAARDLWCAALARVGADPLIGRRLPGLLAARGFAVSVALFDTLAEPALTRFDFLRDLPLTDEEAAALQRVEQIARQSGNQGRQVAHLPFFLITAIR
ncbi:MAG: methyltransferase domain-containing protein [Anaerolineae bacterium]|nr:methyltransferase domain-containing protein [Anaerolineae bacterium]